MDVARGMQEWAVDWSSNDLPAGALPSRGTAPLQLAADPREAP